MLLSAVNCMKIKSLMRNRTTEKVFFYKYGKNTLYKQTLTYGKNKND